MGYHIRVGGWGVVWELWVGAAPAQQLPSCWHPTKCFELLLGKQQVPRTYSSEHRRAEDEGKTYAVNWTQGFKFCLECLQLKALGLVQLSWYAVCGTWQRAVKGTGTVALGCYWRAFSQDRHLQLLKSLDTQGISLLTLSFPLTSDWVLSNLFHHVTARLWYTYTYSISTDRLQLFYHPTFSPPARSPQPSSPDLLLP